jgi:HEAT repeat protein
VIGIPRGSARFDRQVALPLAVVFALGGSLRAAPQAGAPAAPAAQFDAGVLGAVERILTPAASAPEVEPHALVAALVQLGPPAIPVVVAMLCGEVEAAYYVPGTLEEPVQPAVLELRDGILRGALAGFDQRAVLEHVRERLARESGMDVRLALATTLGRMQDKAAFELLLELADGIESIHLQRSYVQGSLEPAIAAHLVRDLRLLHVLDQRAYRADAALLGVYARSVGSTHSARGVEVLAGWIGRHGEADAVILTQIGRTAGDGGLAISPAATATVRRNVSSGELQVQRAALVALGRLRDSEAFEVLVAALEAKTSLAATSARWSLSRICGVDLGDQAQAWKDWREREDLWWSEKAPALIEGLRAEQSGLVLQSMAELARHPLHRHAVAEVIGPLLAHPDDSIARAACAAIARLESSRAVPWLLDALSRPDAELRRIACESLTRLTGLALPPDPLVWSRQLAG